MEEELKKMIREVLVEFFGENPSSGYKPTLNIKETAEYIGYSTAWVRKNKDILPPRVSDKPILYLRTDLGRWLDSRKVKNQSVGKVKIKAVRE